MKVMNVLDGAWLDQGLFWRLIECSTHNIVYEFFRHPHTSKNYMLFSGVHLCIAQNLLNMHFLFILHTCPAALKYVL